jgi:DNA-binding NarL/FixJ family response regulator
MIQRVENEARGLSSRQEGVEDRVAPSPRTDDGALLIQQRISRHRVLIVDDHQIMRQGLAGLMRYEPDIEVVGQAADGPQAIELAGRLQPDVIIMDVNLGEMSGIEATGKILARTPQIKIIGLSMYADPVVAAAMRKAGAVAYLTKGGPSEELAMTIRACCG